MNLTALFRANRAGWILVAVSFAMLALSFSGRASLGLMMPIWEKELGWSRSFLSAGGSVMLVTSAIISPIAGYLLDRLGARASFALGLAAIGAALLLAAQMTEPWEYIVLFCALAGVGFGTASVTQAAAALALVFENMRGLAIGVASSGSTGGQLLLVPLLAVLAAGIGWRSSLVLFAILVLALIPIALRAVPAKPVRATGAALRDGSLAQRLRSLAGNRAFWLLLGGFTVCGFTTTGIVEVHMIPYAVSCGFPQLESATAYGVMSGVNMLGIIGCGFLADRMHRPALLAAIYFARGLTFFLMMHIGNDSTLLFLFAVLFGFVNLSVFAVVASLVASHIGLRMMGLALGILFSGHSFGAALGAFFGGYIFDLQATYDLVWVVGFLLAALAALMSLAIGERKDSSLAPLAQPA